MITLRFNGHRPVLPDAPAGDVVVMRAPVRHRPAGVIPPPAESAVAAFVHVFHLRRLAEPEVKIQSRRRHLAGLERPAAKPAGNPHVHFLKLADAAVADQFAREAEPPVAALLRAGLENNFIFAHGLDDVPALVNRQRQRLLAVNVLLRVRGGDVHERVPVIRRGLNDDVNVVPLQHLSEVGVFVRRLAVLGEFLHGGSRCSWFTSQTARMSP